jgi:ATP dependent DNA ligase domain
MTPRSDGYIPPCIPTRAYRVPAGSDWVHEIKHDGYRLQVRRDGDTVRLFTRRGYDWTARYPGIAATLRDAQAALERREQPVIDRADHGRGIVGLAGVHLNAHPQVPIEYVREHLGPYSLEFVAALIELVRSPNEATRLAAIRE